MATSTASRSDEVLKIAEDPAIPVSDQAVNASTSAGDDEKPVREKLRDAAISSQRGSQSPDSSDAEMGQFTPPEEESESKQSAPNERVKPARKRSLDDLKEPEAGISNLDAPATPSSGTHARKRNKEQNQRDFETTIGKDQDTAVPAAAESPGTPRSGNEQSSSSAMSPRRKRSAEGLDSQENGRSSKLPATEEAQKARKSLDEDRPTLPVPGSKSWANSDGDSPVKSAATTSKMSSGFGNSSAQSPFSTFGAAPKNSLNSSASPFSTFGSSANTETSKPSEPLSFKTAKSPFGNAFGTGSASGSAFGGASSTNAFGGANRISSFASAKPDVSLPSVTTGKSAFGAAGLGNSVRGGFAKAGGGDFGAAKTSKPFGQPEAESKDKNQDTDAEEGSGEGDDDATEVASEADETNKYQMLDDVATGEEDEETIFATRAKLYIFNAGWKERGVGIIKLNKPIVPFVAPESSNHTDDLEARGQQHGEDAHGVDEPAKPHRLLMRAMGVHRTILNSNIFKDMPVGDPNELTKPPSGKNMIFMGTAEDGKLAKYLIKIGREDELTKLYDAIKEVQNNM